MELFLERHFLTELLTVWAHVNIPFPRVNGSNKQTNKQTDKPNNDSMEYFGDRVAFVTGLRCGHAAVHAGVWPWLCPNKQIHEIKERLLLQITG